MMRAKMTCIKIKTGDYRFDIYRIKKDHVGSRWEGFNPLTNVMVLPEFILSINVSSHFFLQWLHYIALKLLHSKDLKPPGGARVVQTTGAVFSEKESHRGARHWYPANVRRRFFFLCGRCCSIRCFKRMDHAYCINFVVSNVYAICWSVFLVIIPNAS